MPKPSSNHNLFRHECTGRWILHPKPQYTASFPTMQVYDRSYNAGYYVAPKYSMRGKHIFGTAQPKSTSTDTAGPINIDGARYKPPVYSMRARTCKMLQLPGMTMDSVPGPGAYPIPATTYFDHPCIKMPRRCTMGTAQRFSS